MLGSLHKALFEREQPILTLSVSRGFLHKGEYVESFILIKEPNPAGYYVLFSRGARTAILEVSSSSWAAWSSFSCGFFWRLSTPCGVQLALLERLFLSSRISFPSPLQEGKELSEILFQDAPFIMSST